MPSSRDRWFFALSIGTCAAIAFGVGGLALYRRLHRKTRSSFLTLKRELIAVKEELVQLKQAIAGLRNETVQDYAAESTEESDDVEFYDALSGALSSCASLAESLDSADDLPDLESDDKHSKKLTYEYIDYLLASEKPETRQRTYLLLIKHVDFHKDDFEFLWRLARCTFLYAQNFKKTDEEKKKKLCLEARKYAYDALKLNENDANVHKWCALTVGALSDFLGLKCRLKNGFTCKEHILRSLELNPSDWFSHYVYGRWCFAVAGLSWIERKVATALFQEPPVATYEEALAEFLEAERLQAKAWKENMMYIAKCYLEIGNSEMAHEYLIAADSIPIISLEDEAAQEEISLMLSQFQ